MEAVVIPIEDKPYKFRPYKLSDLNFIQSSWGSSYYTGCQGYQILKPDQFHEHHRPIRSKILNKPNIAIIVCCASDEEDQILGYTIVEKPHSPCLILHYIYVKQIYKGEHIAKQLLKMSVPERPVLFTHQTIQAQKIISKLKARGREDLDRFLFCPHLT